MTLVINSPQIDKLARELSRTTGESVDEAIEKAIRERLDREKLRENSPELLLERILAISGAFANLQIQDTRSPDEIIHYDDVGLPS